MKPIIYAFAATALLGLGACDFSLSGQKQTEQGAIQMPGERPAPNVALAVPPDEWAGPGRPTQTANAR